MDRSLAFSDLIGSTCGSTTSGVRASKVIRGARRGVFRRDDPRARSSCSTSGRTGVDGEAKALYERHHTSGFWVDNVECGTLRRTVEAHSTGLPTPTGDPRRCNPISSWDELAGP
jgi:hypothetical protein